ncbi:zinc finger transcription factor sma protein, putative (macronuclear) [Tetrahymena thermophila SB210]|uniref:Zinc finger transcription factor sma protein, putative n=1 Tax=Tetrahymena thermophila (strain SB210) TaxID=312017 RepID=Q239K9_TETTS|nr:zinc finger transcription factor sma protein, putative [Tetrahymena thermophila SB210]EAR93220.2 zinc finger transcription factor sma protein, putative [Tetrahymena thermophila SB210]|eukprot:XP_001013465.2 zinc finger transcription factor sma protein, putative [Tetrahymena thermophila SB210]
MQAPIQTDSDKTKEEIDQNWQWNVCNTSIKILETDSEKIIDLTPSNVLELPPNSTRYKVDLLIKNESAFMFSGVWEWHKSWKIPTINCTLNITDPQTNESIILPKSEVYAEIYAVKEFQQNSTHLENVSILGENRSYFKNSQCSFKYLKFIKTSYDYSGSNFQLVIAVYLNQINEKYPIVLESRISPPIFVYNRYGCGVSCGCYKTKIKNYFFDPFLPESLDRKYVKRFSRKKHSKDLPIENDINGLSNFISAPNIRFKIKHPVFLAIKFSYCVKMYHNTNLIPYSDDYLEFLQVVQYNLQTTYINSKMKNDITIQEIPLILYVEHTLSLESIELKRIRDFFKLINENVVQIVQDPQTIPENFKEVKDIERIKEAYQKAYLSLIKIKDELKSPTDSEEESSQDTSKEQLIKKYKTEKSELETVTEGVQKLQINNNLPQQNLFDEEKISQNSLQSGQLQGSNQNTKNSNQFGSILDFTFNKNDSILNDVKLSVFTGINFGQQSWFEDQIGEIRQFNDDIKYTNDDINHDQNDYFYQQTRLSVQQSENYKEDIMNSKLLHQPEAKFENQGSSYQILSSIQQKNQQLTSYGQINQQEQPNLIINKEIFQQNQMKTQADQVSMHHYSQNMMQHKHQYFTQMSQYQNFNQIRDINMPSFEKDSQSHNNNSQFLNNQINQQTNDDFSNQFQQNQNETYQQKNTLQNSFQQFWLNPNNQFQQFQHQHLIQQSNVDDQFNQNNFIRHLNSPSTYQKEHDMQEEK